jgi:hypothetical protein
MDHLQSPFAMPQEDVAALNASEGFSTLRSYLARNAEYVVFLPHPLRECYPVVKPEN